MNRATSLCITYVYHDPNKGPRPSVYRIADYEDGEFFPLDPQSFTDEAFSFNPRYLRTRPGEEGRLYTPTLRSWKAIPMHDDLGRLTTESYHCDDCEIYEVVVNRDLMDPDTCALQNKLRGGFKLPDGVCETFLLAIDQDVRTFTVARCRKSMLKQVGDLFYFNDNISDMLHATHCLDTFVINKSDVFNTSPFSGFYTEDRVAAPSRAFYKFDCLPDSDGPFYLHEISEYIPFFITRFLKKESIKYDLSKAQIQKLATAMEEAVASEESIEAFFAVTGYGAEEIKQLLPEYKKIITRELLGYDEIDSILAALLEADDDAKLKFIELAKHNWLMMADQDREDAESDLAYLKEQVLSAEKAFDALTDQCIKAEKNIAGLNEEIRLLTLQKSDIESAASEAVQHLENSIGTYLSNHAFLKKMGFAEATASKQDSMGIVVTYPLELSGAQCRKAENNSQAVGVLQSNLKKSGMRSYFANIIAAQVHNVKSRVKAYIVSAIFAREFSNAISNSIDGQDATVISVVNTQPDYLQVRSAIEQAPGRVVLIENLLDYCNTVIYASVCRDCKDRIVVFSIDDEAGLAVSTKSIWNYAWLINTDLAFESLNETAQFTKALVGEMPDKTELDYDLEGYTDLNEMLLGLELPLIARQNLIGMTRHLEEFCGPIDPTDFVESVVSKLCAIYYSVISEEDLLPIIEKLPENISSLYFKQ